MLTRNDGIPAVWEYPRRIHTECIYCDTCRAYLQSPRVLIRPAEGHLNVLNVQGFRERERDRTRLSVGDEALAA